MIPECPKCGCNDIVKAGPPRKVWGKEQQRMCCNHCRHHWTQTCIPPPPVNEKPPDFPEKQPTNHAPEGVTYHVLRCPDCGSDKVVVTKTVRPVRYHKCQACFHNFKSVEEPVS